MWGDGGLNYGWGFIGAGGLSAPIFTVLHRGSRPASDHSHLMSLTQSTHSTSTWKHWPHFLCTYLLYWKLSFIPLWCLQRHGEEDAVWSFFIVYIMLVQTSNSYCCSPSLPMTWRTQFNTSLCCGAEVEQSASDWKIAGWVPPIRLGLANNFRNRLDHQTLDEFDSYFLFLLILSILSIWLNWILSLHI